MADEVYKEDFFQRIVAVNWESLCLVFEGGGGGDPAAAPASMTIEFPGSAGGTPGFTLNDGFVPRSGFNAAPFKITQKIMDLGLFTGAGLGFKGYGAYSNKVAAGDTPPELWAGVALRLGGDNFTSQFRVLITIGDFAGLPLQMMRLALVTGVSPGGSVGSETFAGSLTPGYKVPSIVPAGAKVVADFAAQVNYGNVFNLLVDPEKRTISF